MYIVVEIDISVHTLLELTSLDLLGENNLGFFGVLQDF